MKMTKRLAALTAALVLTATGVGGAVSADALKGNNALTASAADVQTISLSSVQFGLNTPAESIEVYRGAARTNTYTWTEFMEGVTFTADDNTTIVLHYADGDLTFDANTRKLLANTRESRVWREVINISCNGWLGGYLQPFGSRAIGFISTRRDPETGNVWTYEKLDGVDTAGLTKVSNVYTENNAPKEFVSMPFYDYTEYFMVDSDSGVMALGGYDFYTDANTGYVTFKNTTRMDLNAEKFPDGVGCKSVTIYGNYVNLPSTATVGSKNASSVSFTAAEFESNKAIFDYGYSSSVTDVSNNLDKVTARVVFEFADGGTIEYVMFGDTPIINNWDKDLPPMTDANGNTVTDNNGNPLVGARDSRGNPQVSDEILQSPEMKGDYTVTIYEGTKELTTLTSKVYEMGIYTIATYNPDKHYYVQVGYDNAKSDAVWYRYNEELGAWVKRVDTKEQAVYEASVNPYTFGGESAGGTVNVRGQKLQAFTAQDFYKTAKFSMITKDCMTYTVTFDYGTGGASEYMYMGIDPEQTAEGTYGEGSAKPTVDVEVEGNPGDNVHVEGKDKDGNDVDFDFVIPEGDGNTSVELPDGEYRFTDKDTELFDDKTIEDGETDGNVNLNTPEETDGEYTLTSPDGSLFDKGTVKDGEFDHVSDTNKSKAEFDKDGFYHGYEYVKGVKNSTNPDKATRERGYVTVDEDGYFEKVDPSKSLRGDVNLDGKVTVADAVMLQKYILAVQSFQIENFINADVYADGEVNVFDLAILKRMLLNS